MKSRGVVGKRIVAIQQGPLNTGRQRDGRDEIITDVMALVLEDGTRLYPHTLETDIGYYAHTLVVRKPKKEKP